MASFRPWHQFSRYSNILRIRPHPCRAPGRVRGRCGDTTDESGTAFQRRRAVLDVCRRSACALDADRRRNSLFLSGGAKSGGAPIHTGGKADSVAEDDVAKVWKLDTKRSSKFLERHDDRIEAIFVRPDDKAVAISGDDTLKVSDIASGRTLRTFHSKPLAVRGVTMLAGGKAVSWRCHDEDRLEESLKMWDLASGALLASFAGEDQICACAVASDGCTIVCGGLEGRVCLLRLASRQSARRRR